MSKGCCAPRSDPGNPTDDTSQMMRTRCARPPPQVRTSAPAVGYIPPRFHKYVPRLDDHDVGNHVVQARRHTHALNKRFDGCGFITRFHGQRCCVMYELNRDSDLNPTCSSQRPGEQDRVIALSQRPQGWCSVKDSVLCDYMDYCPISFMCPFKDKCLNKKKNRTYRYMTSNSKTEAERGYNVAFWLEDLQIEINLMEEELSNLQERTSALEQLLRGICDPLDNATKTQVAHQSRLCKDSLTDEVDESLCQERLNIIQTRELLRDMYSRSRAQIRRNQQELDNLIGDYVCHKNLNPAESCRYQQTINRRSTEIGFHPGVRVTNRSAVAPEEWLRSVRRSVQASRQERARTVKLCQKLERMMSAGVNEIWHRANISNVALKASIDGNVSDRKQIMKDREKVLHDVDIIDRRLRLIRRSVEKKQNSEVMEKAMLEQRQEGLSEDICGHLERDLMPRSTQDECKAMDELAARLATDEGERRGLMEQCKQLEQRMLEKKCDYKIDTRVSAPIRYNQTINPIDPPILNKKLFTGVKYC